jgi:hypothetical protein
MNSTFLRVLVLALAVLSIPRAFAAGDEDWHFTITPYLWLPSVDTKLSVRDEPIEVGTNTNSFDVFSKLDYGFLVLGEVRKGKLGLFYDFQTLKLSDDGTIYTAEPRDFNYDLTFADATLALEYRVVDHPRFTLDALAGARALYAKVSIDVDAVASDRELKGEQTHVWVDPIIGGKCHYQINEHWGLAAYGDVGGFGVGSQLTAQVMGSVQYWFTDSVALQVGYRFFTDNFENGGFKFDTKLYGPVIGLTFAF